MQLLDDFRPAWLRSLALGVLTNLAVGFLGVGRIEAQVSRPMVARVLVVQPAVSRSVLAAGRALWAARIPGRPVRAEVGVATVSIAADRRAVLTIQYFRN